MNGEQNEGRNQDDPNNLGSDPDVPLVHLPLPEHAHHPTTEAQHRHHYVKRSIDLIRHHWPTAASWNVIASMITAIATVMMVIVYIQIEGIMQSSGGQTDKLIDAAEIQALASRRIAQASRRQAHAADRNASAAESFSQSADNINRNTKEAIDEFEKSSQAQLNLMKSQIEDFENFQIGNLTIEGVSTPALWDKPTNPTVSFKVFNRGHSLITDINKGNGSYTAPANAAQALPDWQMIAKQMREVRFYRVPHDTLEIDGHFEDKFVINPIDEVRTHQMHFVYWMIFRYSDIFGKNRIKTACLWYLPGHGGEHFEPCQLDTNPH